ncbi:hypothetical protein HMPREF3199_01701, partial [Enterococcus faecium]
PGPVYNPPPGPVYKPPPGPVYAPRFCCKVFQKIYFSVKLRKKTERTE